MADGRGRPAALLAWRALLLHLPLAARATQLPARGALPHGVGSFCGVVRGVPAAWTARCARAGNLHMLSEEEPSEEIEDALTFRRKKGRLTPRKPKDNRDTLLYQVQEVAASLLAPSWPLPTQV